MTGRTKAYIYAVLGVLLFLLMFGIVGGMDANTIPAGKGTLGALACVLVSGVCMKTAGMLYDD